MSPLEIAREMFAIAATTNEQTAESRIHGQLSDARERHPARVAELERKLAAATRRVEAKRREAFERFDKATGYDLAARAVAPQTVELELGLVLDARSAIASQISWLESLHPARSRVERLRMLRPVFERLLAATPGHS